YLTFGHYDWLTIAEFPDDKAAASAILAAAAGGSLTDIETTPAMTAKDAHATFVSAAKAAKSFRSAGRA
ncbi:MAG: GYD domain-containing protein, partial [Pseudolabrys sp.]